MQPVTPGYNLRKRYMPSKAVKEDHSLDTYIQYLKKQGLEVNPSIKPAMFSLQNGLLYPGLKTQKTLSGPHLLVKIPKSMLLNTKVANIPVLQKLFQQQFYHSKNFNWQDRIIITFLLYTYAKKQDTIWFQMVNNLSKDIDILNFWTQEDINHLQDPIVSRVCKKAKNTFHEQYTGFSETIKKYPDVIPSQFIKQENYLWLYIHLVSRSFGKFLKHVTMVPFCELFNHHNSDVLYDFLYDEDNPLKATQTKYDDPSKYDTEEMRAEVSSSDGTYNSEQYFDEDQFDYSNIEVQKIKWGGKTSFTLKDKETNQVQKKYKQLTEWLQNELYWDDHSIIIIAQAIQKLNIIKNEYMAGRKKYPEAMQSLTKLRQICQIYKMKLQQFYKLIKGQKFQYRTLMFPQSTEQIPTQRFMEDKFDYFTMRMNKRDHFQENNQVYFCYGRLSNRMMLERYGMAIEGNKYDHIWISLYVVPFIEGYPDTLQKMQEKKLSVKRKFKLKRREINLQMLVFFRMSKWQLMRHNINGIFSVMDLQKQMKALEQCVSVVEKQMQKMKSLSELQAKLCDKNVGYHQYFGTVYKLQHRKILQLHLEAYKHMQQLVRIMMDQGQIEEYLELLSKSQEGRQMKWYLSKYLIMLKKD